MKKIPLIIFVLSFNINLFGQNFVQSHALKLTNPDNSSKKKLDKNDSYETDIFLKNANNEKIKKITINTDSFSEEYSHVQEIAENQLKNIKKVVKVNIQHCACYCNLDIYYWLITNDGIWIELPKIEQNDYDIGNTYQEYVFRKENTTTIELIEFREKMTNIPDKNSISGFKIKRIYEKKIKDLIWNGNQLVKK